MAAQTHHQCADTLGTLHPQTSTTTWQHKHIISVQTRWEPYIHRPLQHGSTPLFVRHLTMWMISLQETSIATLLLQFKSVLKYRDAFLPDKCDCVAASEDRDLSYSMQATLMWMLQPMEEWFDTTTLCWTRGRADFLMFSLSLGFTIVSQDTRQPSIQRRYQFTMNSTL